MNKPAKPCLRCRKRTTNDGGYCDACMARKAGLYDNMRGSSARRGYGGDWRKVRASKLAMNPLCECGRCHEMNRMLVADTVHHIKPVERRPDLRLNIDNLMSMSARCHEVEHGRAKDLDYLKWQRRGV